MIFLTNAVGSVTPDTEKGTASASRHSATCSQILFPTPLPGRRWGGQRSWASDVICGAVSPTDGCTLLGGPGGGVSALRKDGKVNRYVTLERN